MQYNAEGLQIGANSYVLNNGAFYPGPILAAVYTARGELSKDLITTGPAQLALMANGTRIPLGNQLAAFSWNALQGMPVSSTTADSTTNYAYDAVGRQASATGDATTYTRQYDADNQLLVDAVSDGTFASGRQHYRYSLGYNWGPLGHPFQMGSTSAVPLGSAQPTDFQYASLYWDDDTLLFTTNAAGQVDDIKIGGIADYTPNSAQSHLTVWDRESHGRIVSCHNTVGSGSATVPSTFQPASPACTLATPFTVSGFPPPMVGRGALVTSAKTDGISDGTNTFQGSRTYDSQAGVWVTPDAYRGNVQDPMSQKPYMWNRNDPYSYSDPSGFVPEWDKKYDAEWNASHGVGDAGDNALAPIHVGSGAIAKAIGAPGQMHLDIGDTIIEVFNRLASFGVDPAQLTMANVAVKIAEALIDKGYGVEELFAKNGAMLLKVTDQTLIGGNQVGGLAVIRIAIDGLSLDVREFDARNENLLYHDEFQWRQRQRDGMIWWHNFQKDKLGGIHWDPFNGYAAPQAGPGQS